MADSVDAPDWSRLPHDPVGFFELAEGFDRKDLKRAYNRLLRQFKPEKHPQEFQRIRAAFEQLDERLRYGTSPASGRSPAPYAWENDAGPTEGPPSRPTEPLSGKRSGEHADPVPGRTIPHTPPPRRSLAERLASEPPEQLYAELKAKERKSPFDYYALAVLADVVEKKPMVFVEWLLRGVRAHPGDAALLQLLHEFFRSPLEARQLVQILPAAARAIGTDLFYPLTEPAWQLLLHDGTFDEFERTLATCEQHLRDSRIVGRMTFVIQILRSAMWHDPNGEWSRRQLDYIDENFEQIPPWLEWDVDFLGAARNYLVAVRRQFVKGSPLRARIDQALRDYFCEAQEVGDRAIVACQFDILTRSAGLLAAFPLEDAELLAQFFPLWSWVSYDVAQRQGVAEVQEVDENVWASRANVLLDRMQTACNNSPIGWAWSLALVGRYVTLGVVGLVVALSATIVGLAIVHTTAETTGGDPGGWDLMGLVVALGLTVLAVWKLKPLLDRKVWFPLNEKFARRCYRLMWRQELLDFQGRSHVPDQFFRGVFAHFSERDATSSWVAHFVQSDYAPAMLALAQRFEN